jgi:hypothetical protein
VRVGRPRQGRVQVQTPRNLRIEGLARPVVALGDGEEASEDGCGMLLMTEGRCGGGGGLCEVGKELWKIGVAGRFGFVAAQRWSVHVTLRGIQSPIVLAQLRKNEQTRCRNGELKGARNFFRALCTDLASF